MANSAFPFRRTVTLQREVVTMKKRTIVSFILLVALISSLGIPVMATTHNSDGNEVSFDLQGGFDTLDYSQEDYFPAHVNTRMQNVDDEAQIEQLIVGFLASSKAYIRSPNQYNNGSQFIANSAKTSAPVEYRIAETEYKRALNEAMGWEITSDNISFDNFTIDVSGSQASASVVEDYTYYITDGFDSESFRRREYSFELQNGANGWEIVSVKTNDPWEEEDGFSYDVVDVESHIAEVLTVPQTLDSGDVLDEEDLAVPAATTLNRWTYSTSDAVDYAVDHYKDNKNGDSIFGFTTGNNCQNFASQCVWAGLGGSGSSTSARPAVSTSVAGSDGPNVWQRNVATKCYSSSTYWLNWTWDTVRGFANMMVESDPDREGPCGNTQYSGKFRYAAVGNVLSVDWDGNPSRDTLDHAMFVTEVSGTSGSRTTSQVKVAAHTNPTNSAYETVANYTGMPASAFARVVIYRGYYSTVQP